TSGQAHLGKSVYAADGGRRTGDPDAVHADRSPERAGATLSSLSKIPDEPGDDRGAASSAAIAGRVYLREDDDFVVGRLRNPHRPLSIRGHARLFAMWLCCFDGLSGGRPSQSIRGPDCGAFDVRLGANRKQGRQTPQPVQPQTRTRSGVAIDRDPIADTTAGPSTTLLRSSGRDANCVVTETVGCNSFFPKNFHPARSSEGA